jgi:hypothetical protein
MMPTFKVVCAQCNKEVNKYTPLRHTQEMCDEQVDGRGFGTGRWKHKFDVTCHGVTRHYETDFCTEEVPIIAMTVFLDTLKGYALFPNVEDLPPPHKPELGYVDARLYEGDPEYKQRA